MARYVEMKENRLRTLTCKAVSLSQIKAGGAPLAQKILSLLAERASYSNEIAKRLGVHEQKIYYHMRKLEAAGLILPERREEMRGASAKYYRLAEPSFAVTLKEPIQSGSIGAVSQEVAEFLSPFIIGGKPSFLIVVGNPLAHGPRMAQARDGSYAIDLALFLGSFLSEQPEPVVKLDTEMNEEDLQQNLIIIGGPIVNTVASKVNEKLPIKFLEDGKSIYSTESKRTYNNEQIGVIVKAENPFSEGKGLLFIAGRGQAGTKAAIITFLKHFEELMKGKMARVVEGKDLDSDGVVDTIEFRE